MRLGRRGFTFIETLVALALGTSVLVALWAVFRLANRSQGATAAARGIQTAAMIEEVITGDLRRLISVGGSGIRFYEDDPAKLSFYSAVADQSWQGNVVDVRAVHYFIDRPAPDKPGPLKRECDARAESVGVSPLTSLVFTPFMSPSGPLVRVTLAVGRDPTEPEGAPRVHTFIARPGRQRPIPAMAFKTVSEFKLPEEQRPRGQPLPRL